MAKTELEKKFDKVSDEYFEKFGKNYLLCRTDMRPLQEHIRIMEQCIKDGKPAKQAKYEEGAVY